MRKHLRALLGALALAAAATNIAGATPPVNFTAVLTARGAATDTFKITVPETKTVTQKVKVKVKVKGKLVTRTKTRKVTKTVDTPINTCGPSTACDFATQTVTVQPGGSTGWHHHPGLVLVVVKSGSVTRYLMDCSKATYNPGQAFAELGEKHVAFVRNEGTAVAELMVAFVSPPGAALRIDDNAPANCNP